jgi:transcriptional regulator
MYIPQAFQETAREVLHAFVRRHSFATLVTCTTDTNGATIPFASHVPLLLDAGRGSQGVLRGHLARANPQWRHFDAEQEVLAIFHGPHAFVSANWYADPPNMVPTWNYAAVHVYGKPRILAEADEVFTLLQDMLAYYQPEGNPMSLQPPTQRVQQLAQAIVAFELTITRWEGKFKLSQNRTAEDQGRVREALLDRGEPEGLAVAQMMQDWEKSNANRIVH